MWSTREEGTVYFMAFEKKNQLLLFSDNNKLPTLWSIAPVGKSATRFSLERWTLGIFLSPLNISDGFYLSYPGYPTKSMIKIETSDVFDVHLLYRTSRNPWLRFTSPNVMTSLNVKVMLSQYGTCQQSKWLHYKNIHDLKCSMQVKEYIMGVRGR